MLNPIVTSNYQAEVRPENCVACMRCAKKCPVNAIHLAFKGHGSKKTAIVDENICLGCGVCIDSCNKDALHMKAREKRVITPKTTMERLIRMAIERGKLQHLLFNPGSDTQRLLGKALGILLKLPPAKQLHAKEQLRSRFINSILSGMQRTKLKKVTEL